MLLNYTLYYYEIQIQTELKNGKKVFLDAAFTKSKEARIIGMFLKHEAHMAKTAISLSMSIRHM